MLNNTAYLPSEWVVTFPNGTFQSCMTPDWWIPQIPSPIFALWIEGLVLFFAVTACHIYCIRHFCNTSLPFRGHNVWTVWAFLPVLLQLIGNLVVGARIRRNSVYPGMPPLGKLILLYTVRPRASWIVMMVLSYWVRWRSLFRALMSAEILLQFVALYNAAAVLAWGLNHEFINRASLEDMTSEARLMYAGAALSMIALNLFGWVALFRFREVYGYFSQDREDERNPPPHAPTAAVISFWFFLAVGNIGNWFFWSGFHYVGGRPYCGPLSPNGYWWILFSCVGTFFAAWFY